MDWINCNVCCRQLSENSNTKFSLTSCGHIFCENCECFVAGTLDCCRVCRTKCSSILIGDKSFQTNLQVLKYFQEPEKMCETMLEVMKFQKSHLMKLIKHHQRILSKYNKAKLYIKKLENELMVMNNALQNSSSKRQKYEYNVTVGNQSMTSTSTLHPNSIPFKKMDAKTKCQHSPNLKRKIPDKRYREQLFQSESSLLSKESSESGIHTDHASSSLVDLSSSQQSNEVSYTTEMDKLQSHLYGNWQFRRE